MDSSAQDSPDRWDRKRTLRFLTVALCALDGLIYLLGGTFVTLALGILFGVSAVGLGSHKWWGLTVAATSVGIAVVVEILMLVGGRHSPIGVFMREILHIVLIFQLISIWKDSPGEDDTPSMGNRGTI